MREEPDELPSRYDITPSKRTLHMQKGSPPPPELALPDLPEEGDDRGRARRPDRRDDTGLGRLSDHEHDIGLLIAGLIDGELERRQPLTEFGWFRRALGIKDVRSVHTTLGPIDYRMAAWRLRQLMEDNEPTATADADGLEHPRWTAISLPGRIEQVPESIRVAFPAGTVLEHPCGVSLRPLGDNSHYIGFLGPRDHPMSVHDLSNLVRSVDGANPYQGHVLEVADTEEGPDLRVVAEPPDDRASLILPDRIWREIDENIGNLFANREILIRLGLGLNRGILLTGPPGTGKTHLTRVVAAELAGTVTVLFVSPSVMSRRLRTTYRIAEQLAPSLVVLEDVDLAVAQRDGGASESLNDFLVAVDGAMTQHTGIVTIATTNDVNAIDDAAKRAARFDRIIEVPMPPAVGRRRIWERYLDGLDGEFDIDWLVRATRGGSGADVREIVRHAILVTNGAVTTDVLIEGAKDRGLGRTQRIGQYL